MSSSDYNNYLSSIKAANDAQDKELLKKIKAQLISNYGLQDNDVQRLLGYFRYDV